VLRKQRENDPKVLHNIAITEYLEGGGKEPRKLLSVLEKLKQGLEDAKSEAESVEGASLNDALSDADSSLTAYNTAVLQYQLKQYALCRTLLEDMFSNIEPIDELLAFKVCFLLLDVYLLQRQPDKAAEVLSYLERSYAALTKSDGNKENGVSDVADAEGKGAPAMPGEWPKKSARRPPTEITPEEVRAALNLYKAKLSLMSRSTKSSKREIKTALNACTQNTTGLFLKSNLEYLRQNFRKAIKLLNNSCQKGERDANVAALYFNNMGCIHHCMRRHSAAAFYFHRALLENHTLYNKAAAGGITLSTFSCDRRCEIEYNRALQLLFSGRPAQAFSGFHAALLLFHRQPRVWLRLGEACVAQHIRKQEEEQLAKQRAQLSPLVSTAAGTGEKRRLVIPLDTDALTTFSGAEAPPVDEVPISEVAEPAAPTLAFGVKCLRNALQLCESQLGSVSSTDYAALQASASQGTLSPSEEFTLQLHVILRLSLLQLAWCALEQDDYVQALHCSSQLLTDDCPASLKVHVHLYTADALCHLNRSSEALDHLNRALQLGEVATVVSCSGEASAQEADLEPVRNPYSPISATRAPHHATPRAASSVGSRSVLYGNLATVHVLRNDLEAATKYVHQALALQPDSRQALLCLVYLELKAGNTERAVAVLRKHRAPAATKS